MELTPNQKLVRDNTIVFAKKNKKRIAREIVDISVYTQEQNPISVFMAGSPGAGKTEVSKALIESYGNVLRIDADDLRDRFVDYDGSNSWLFQPAVSILVEKIHDLALSQRQSFIFDGTLTNQQKAISNIRRSLGKARMVEILYVYQNPVRAWEFVLAREQEEGRKIKRADFIHQYFQARSSVNELKKLFENDITVDLLLQNNENSQQEYRANIDIIDNHLVEKYTPAALETLLKAR